MPYQGNAGALFASYLGTTALSHLFTPDERDNNGPSCFLNFLKNGIYRHHSAGNKYRIPIAYPGQRRFRNAPAPAGAVPQEVQRRTEAGQRAGEAYIPVDIS
jgi:hypothetical protein